LSWTDGPLVLSSCTLASEIGSAERVRVAAEAISDELVRQGPDAAVTYTTARTVLPRAGGAG
jgi:hypothetical protein